MLISNETVHTFINHASCQTRLAAKWFKSEVCLNSFSCGSVNHRLNYLVSWKIEITEGASENNPGLSCKDIKDKCPLASNGIYWINPNPSLYQNSFQVYCKDGWTLMIKIDGAKTTFEYSSSLWTSTAGLATDSVQIDQIEAKFPSYWTLPISQLLIVMNSSQGVEKELTIPLPASISGLTIHSLIADGQYRQTNVSKAAWRTLVPDSSLQPNCNLEGFNSGYVTSHCQVRLGIISNEQNDCGSPDSCLGIGGSYITSGNYGSHGADNGDKIHATFSYVYGK